MSEPAPLIPPDPQSARQLIASQFPGLAGRHICPEVSKGTDNHIVRIGDDLCARFPKAPWAVGTARRETRALPRFVGAPIAVPEVYGTGTPSQVFPHPWSVLTWLPGAPLEDSALSDPQEAACRLADFFIFLRSIPPDDEFRFGPDNNWRGAPLTYRTAPFEKALARLPNIDSGWAKRLWSEALRAQTASVPVWLHGDVHPGNVLVTDGQVSGIIDWGLCGVGDGACDLLSAWTMFDEPAREVFRASLGANDADWLRGAGWALSMAVIYLPYAYENALRCDMSEKMIERLMKDFP
ncbi:phosphotransferase family protein [Hyphomonas neptunium ATCC 15444]|uniref:Phosphotransferase family protein n=2 Tax=Hyphomonas TaxID=85 RepID=Q0BYW4_HYPNA|nr:MULTISPECIES: aminoglycoside phosphotransferase family protein [Hyphomonas]ABI77566.1 phosphotransferase family protein [Hyphomonas neptunium ATCC 15444]KCZ91454.1 phosphotransferase family protein [Hyphomonas hirschiana VP5]